MISQIPRWALRFALDTFGFGLICGAFLWLLGALIKPVFHVDITEFDGGIVFSVSWLGLAMFLALLKQLFGDERVNPYEGGRRGHPVLSANYGTRRFVKLERRPIRRDRG